MLDQRLLARASKDDSIGEITYDVQDGQSSILLKSTDASNKY